jgi:HEAT repeat protein
VSSSNWDSFYESYFGDAYSAWHDGLDEQALLALEGEERERAEKLLTEALGSSDYRPAAGLASLRSPKAAEKLKQELPQVSGSVEVQTALALWKIERYMPAADALIGVLTSGEFWGYRADAARVMRNVAIPRAIITLWNAVENDPEALVRSQAASSLLAMYNIPSEIYDMHPLSIDVMTEDKEKREKAVQALKVLVLKEGRLDSD